MNHSKFVTLIGFLVAVLIFGVGRSANAALSDVTPSFTIVRGALVFNRVTNTYDSQVTITNKSGITLFGPVQVVVTTVPVGVSLANGQGVTETGKPFVIFVPAGGQITTGQSVNGILKFHNPNRLNFSAVLNIRADSGTTVPDPGAAGKLTLAGIDINNNGVRDDVEIFIATRYASSQKNIQALNQYAIAAQKKILTKNRDDSFAVATLSSRAMECLTYIHAPRDGWRAVLALTTNTDLRYRAWAAHEGRLSGGAFPSRQIGEWKTSCTFIPDTLAN